jgi:L-lactate dehydrogenase
MTKRVHDEGGRLPGPWLVDADGRASDDPAVLYGERKGAALPLGGLDLGHKGFALALLVEALTSGLAGHGRADGPRDWGASVFLQLIDPAAFGGRDTFTRESSHLADLCHSTPVAPGRPGVRLPGERALERRAEQIEKGIALRKGILESLQPWSARHGVAQPTPIA